MFLKEKINFKILKAFFFFIFLLIFCYEVSAKKSYIIIDEKKITNEIQDNYLDNYYPQYNAIKYSCYLNKKYKKEKKIITTLEHTINVLKKKNITFLLNRYFDLELYGENIIFYKFIENSINSISLISKFSFLESSNYIDIKFPKGNIIRNIKTIKIIEHGKNNVINLDPQSYKLNNDKRQININFQKDLNYIGHNTFKEIIIIFKKNQFTIDEFTNTKIKKEKTIFEKSNLPKVLISDDKDCFFLFSYPKDPNVIQFFIFLKKHTEKEELFFARVEPNEILIND